MIKLINFDVVTKFHLYFGQTIKFHFGYHKVCRYIFVSQQRRVTITAEGVKLLTLY